MINHPISMINPPTTTITAVINHPTTNHQESSDVETLSNCGRGGSSNASDYWLRPGRIQIPQILRIFILNIETRTDSIAWSIENIQNVEYWEQDTFSALIIEKDLKAKTTLYCGSAADLMIEFRVWIFRVWISKLRVRCSKFRGHNSEFGFLSSEFKVQSFLNRFEIFEINSYFK